MIVEPFGGVGGVNTRSSLFTPIVILAVSPARANFTTPIRDKTLLFWQRGWFYSKGQFIGLRRNCDGKYIEC